MEFQSWRGKSMRRIEFGSTLFPVWLAVFLTATSASFLPAFAQDLSGDDLKALALKGTWKADLAEYGFWSWQENGDVCLRAHKEDAECLDTGTWEVSENVLCYELTWWGETASERKNCFTVNALSPERFETVFHGGAMVSRMFAFELVE